MNSVLNVQDIDTMSSCSWNTEKSMLSAAEKSRGGGGAMLADHQPRSPSSNQTKYPIKTLCFFQEIVNNAHERGIFYSADLWFGCQKMASELRL